MAEAVEQPAGLRLDRQRSSHESGSRCEPASMIQGQHEYFSRNLVMRCLAILWQFFVIRRECAMSMICGRRGSFGRRLRLRSV
jgi:hypothetical protein